MSRYYDVVITNPTTGATLKRYTSFPNGVNDPAALNIELDIATAALDAPAGGAYIRVWGVPISDVSQAINLNNAQITVSAGMQAGLPLANPAQAGLIARGFVYQSIGFWEGTSQHLDIVIAAGVGTLTHPRNVVFSWLKGQPFSAAIQTALQIAVPGSTVSTSVSPNLVASEDFHGFYTTIPQLAGVLQKFTKAMLGGSYPGVSIVFHDNKFSVYDGTVKPTLVAISYQDLIGQVSWSDPGTITFKTVLRADIQVGSMVKLPPGQVQFTTQAQPQIAHGPIFQGSFSVVGVRHAGNFRGSTGADWVTVFEAVGPF